ncbi:MAG: FKBP-type peptidyl-prolyl cis-trans isomerase [Opitutaceae bacterium]|jgi:FKBP-type peptidyl-prolyl cis-trans isomerase
MNVKTPFVIGMFALGLIAGVRAEDIKINVPGNAAPAAAEAPTAVAAPVAAAPSAPAIVYSEAQVLEALGFIAAKNLQLESFNFTPTQLESVLKGLALAAQNKELAYDKKSIGPQVAEFVQKRQTEFIETLKKQNNAASAAFFAKLKENKNVQALPSGLCYEIVKPGTGEFPKPTDTVKVHYTGTLITGEVFDSSVQKGEPVEFPLDQVIAGWTEGIQKVNAGGKARLYVPANLAYGDEGRPGIPPGSTLIFDVELLSFKKTPGPASLGVAPSK